MVGTEILRYTRALRNPNRLIFNTVNYTDAPFSIKLICIAVEADSESLQPLVHHSRSTKSSLPEEMATVLQVTSYCLNSYFVCVNKKNKTMTDAPGKLPYHLYKQNLTERNRSSAAKKSNVKKGKTRVNISVAFHRWRQPSKEKQMQGDAELTLLLLDSNTECWLFT